MTTVTAKKVVEPYLATQLRQWTLADAEVPRPRLKELCLNDDGLPVVITAHAGDSIAFAGGLLAMLKEVQLVEVAARDDCPYAEPPPGADREAWRRLRMDDTVSYQLGERCGQIDLTGLTSYFEALLRPGRWCITAWRGRLPDRHRGIEAAAATACVRTGARLLEYLPGPSFFERDTFPWDRTYRVCLPPSVQCAKTHAMAVLRSPSDSAIGQSLVTAEEFFVDGR
jgi:hypothetical protein